MTAFPAPFQQFILAAVPADAPTRVVAREWLWQPVLSVPIWFMISALAVILAVSVYRSRHVRLPVHRRVTLALLRSASLLLAAGLLLQPTTRIRLERTSSRPLAMLVDTSGSMTVQDRSDQPRTRRGQITESLNQLMTSDRRTRTQLFAFDEQIAPMNWSDLSAPVSVEPGLPRTDIAAALRAIRVMTAGQPETQIVLVSDGTDTVSKREGSLLAAAQELAQAGLTLHTVVAGMDKLPTLVIESAIDPLYAFANDPIRVQTRLTAEGLDESMIDATITADGRLLATRRVKCPIDSVTTTESFDITFDRAGLVRCQFEVPSIVPPIVIKGKPTFDVHVIDKPLRVLYVERQPRWTFQFLRNAFQRDRRFDARLVLIGSEREDANPLTDDLKLSDTDVVIIGDIAPQDLPGYWWQRLRDVVMNEGVGLIFAAGPTSLPSRFLDTTLVELFPFRRLDRAQTGQTEPWLLKLTPIGQVNPVMQMQSRTAWDVLPGLYWHAPVRDVKPAAQVLAEKPVTPGSPACPVVLLQRAGRGMVLFVGTDETWRWRYELGDAFFYRFWAQATLFTGLPHRAQDTATSMPTTGQTADSTLAEMADVRARPDLMKHLAREAAGESIPLRDLPALLDRLDQHPIVEQWTETRSCWDQWPTLVILVTLLCAEWLLRRRFHLP